MGPELSLVEEARLELRMSHTANDELDDAAMRCLGLNRTDGRCLDIVERSGCLSAGELAAQSGLTTGAITAVLDRLEQKGYVRRVRDKVDRRRVLVEVTEKTRRCIADIYGPVASEGRARLEQCSKGQLRFLADFTRAHRQLLTEHAARVRKLTQHRDGEDSTGNVDEQID